MLYIASLYGFYEENTVILDPSDNSMLSQQLREENYTVINGDKITYSFFRDPIPDGVNLLLTQPPFFIKRAFFERLEEISKWLLFLFYIIYFSIYFAYVTEYFFRVAFRCGDDNACVSQHRV